MKRLEIKHQAVIIADYKNGHPKILPKQFSALQIEKGGTGAGTELRFSMTAMGTTRNFHQEVFEPTPGQVLVEKDLDSDVTTTFTVLPLGANECSVEIATSLPIRAGLAGWLESVLTKNFILTVYRQELNLLRELVLGKR